MARSRRLSPQTTAVLLALAEDPAAWRYGYQLCLLNRLLTTPGLEINLAWLYASSVVGGVLIAVYGLSMIFAPPPEDEFTH